MSARALMALGALLLALLALVAALAWGLYSSLTTGQQEVVREAFAEQAALLVGSALLFAIALGVVLGAFASRYVRPATRLATETEVIASLDPDHRLTPEGAAEMRAATAAVERLAERYRGSRRDVEETVRRARADVEEERNRLAALMAQLTQPVLVCNADGRILLYNAAARDLLGSGPDAAYVGLGRSLFGVVDRDVVLHALDHVRELAERGEERAAARFATEVAGRLVRAHVSPVRDAGGAMTGFLLVLEDITQEAEVSDRRGAVLHGLIDATQRAVASIRVAVEAVQDFGEVDAAQQERLLRIVRDEAAGLSERLGRARREVADLVAQRWRLELLRGHDVLTLLRRRLEPAEEPRVRLDERGDDLWVRVDGYALTRAIAAVVRRLGTEHGVHELAVSLRPSDAHAALDMRWPGRPLELDTLRAWEEEPLASDGEPVPFTLRDVLDRHGAECWCQRDAATGEGVLRVLLPAAPAPHRRAEPAGAHPVVEPGGRPEFYDFDLFRRREPRPERDAERLAALSYTVLDTETTGLDPEEDELIAIGAVRIVNRRILPQETFDQLIDPGHPISPESVRIHGLSRAMLEGQPDIADVLPRFARFAEDTVLVGHNVAFDMRFLAEKEARTGVRFTQPVLDTLLLSPVVHPEHPDHSLEAIAGRLGVSVIGRHTALGDALLTAEIFLRLLRLLQARGIETLGQALEAARRTLHARVSESLYAPR
jgi:DNA polymerase III subunit epsilon